MAPKRVAGRANKGYISFTYEALTSPENASVVRSVALFGAAVAFLASPWSELVLPPYAIHPRAPNDFLESSLDVTLTC
ncbi:hypothetical protein GGR54DRAFT_644932 [Hypoxylon sp. NC1633]|nr:hypothetical protein GGR54DRAFT_644932 [Hypoxylon sp. NC1633]